MVRMMRADGVRTVVWCTPWVNLDSRDGQIPPQPESERLHREPAPNVRAGGRRRALRPGSERRAVRARSGGWGPARRSISRAPTPRRGGASRSSACWRSGSRGSRPTTGTATTSPTTQGLSDGRAGAEAAWDLGGLHRRALQRALDEIHPGSGVLFGRSGWTGQHADRRHVGRRSGVGLLVAARACHRHPVGRRSGFSNWSHDVGGYLGHRLVERCPPELLVRWLQFGCFTPLMQAHARMPQEPWNYGERVLDLYRGYALAARDARPLHPCRRRDRGPHRAADHPAALPDRSRRPPRMVDHRRLRVRPGAVGRAGARRRRPRARGAATPRRMDRDVVGTAGPCALGPMSSSTHRSSAIPVWVRAGSIVVTYPAEHVARGLGDVPESDRPLVATLWGVPRLGRAAARLGDGTRVQLARRRMVGLRAPSAPRSASGRSRLTGRRHQDRVSDRVLAPAPPAYPGTGGRPRASPFRSARAERRSGAGAHQFHLPSSSISDGTSSARTIDASIRTASAVPMPSSLMNTSLEVANAPIATANSSAAAVTMRPVRSSPTPPPPSPTRRRRVPP